MRIGYFVNRFPYKGSAKNRSSRLYWLGGTENVAYHLAVNMGLKGHKITIFTSSIDSKFTIEEQNRNITVYRYPTNFRIKGRNISPKLFLGLVDDLPLDIIHLHLSNSINNLGAQRYAKKRDLPLVVTYHGDPERDLGGFAYKLGVYLFASCILKKILTNANVIISPSRHYINESRFLREYQDKITVIPNGINIKDFDLPLSKEKCREKLGLPLNKYIILFLGALSPYKGPDILVKAMQKVIKKIPNVELVLCGEGGLKTKLKELSNKLNLNEYLRFAGFIDEKLKPLYYKSADIFVLPSTMKTECYPLAILEAMACGLPIVTSDIGGISDAVKNGKNGLLVPPKNSEALADAIIYLLEGEDVRERMGKNGKEKVKNYSWERITEMTEEVYKSLIEQ